MPERNLIQQLQETWESTRFRQETSRFFEQLTHTGVTDATPAIRKKEIITMNSFAIVVILIAIPYFIIGALLNQQYIVLGVAELLGFAVVLWLNARGHHTAAQYYVAIYSLCVIVSVTIIWGTAAGFHFFLLPYAFCVMIIFSKRHEIAAVLFAFAGIWALAALSIYGNVAPLRDDAFDPAIAPYVFAASLFLVGMACVGFGYQARAISDEAQQELDSERQRSEILLLNILPQPIAERLKRNPGTIAEAFDALTVLFADIVNFTPLSDRHPPDLVVSLLNDVFTEFDLIARRHGVEKIKTIGDAYMAAAGVPRPTDDHAHRIACAALDMRAAVEGFRTPDGQPLQIRIGIHSGTAVAGVIGVYKFSYDLWGDTVNIASRLESHGRVGRIQISDATRHILATDFALVERGIVEIKGKGPMRTWWLESAKPTASTDISHGR